MAMPPAHVHNVWPFAFHFNTDVYNFNLSSWDSHKVHSENTFGHIQFIYLPAKRRFVESSTHGAHTGALSSRAEELIVAFYWLVYVSQYAESPSHLQSILSSNNNNGESGPMLYTAIIVWRLVRSHSNDDKSTNKWLCAATALSCYLKILHWTIGLHRLAIATSIWPFLILNKAYCSSSISTHVILKWWFCDNKRNAISDKHWFGIAYVPFVEDKMHLSVCILGH